MFSFNFDNQSEPQQEASLQETEACKTHSLVDLLPEDVRISYNILSTATTALARRDIFDVKYQLMKKDDLSDAEKLLISNEDVKRTVYEGGLKIWEGTYDLLDVLSAASLNNVHGALELGCGAGLPLLEVFTKVYSEGRPGTFVFADYNAEILSLITAPNLVLAWLKAQDKLPKGESGEVFLTHALIEEFSADLASKNIQIRFVSGGWGKSFLEVISDLKIDLVLASETIYSLDSLPAFVHVVKGLIEKDSSRTFVAAKKVYFGVGGGIVEFERLTQKSGLALTSVKTFGEVGRVVVSVEKAT